MVPDSEWARCPRLACSAQKESQVGRSQGPHLSRGEEDTMGTDTLVAQASGEPDGPATFSARVSRAG